MTADEGPESWRPCSIVRELHVFVPEWRIMTVDGEASRRE